METAPWIPGSGFNLILRRATCVRCTQRRNESMRQCERLRNGSGARKNTYRSRSTRLDPSSAIDDRLVDPLAVDSNGAVRIGSHCSEDARSPRTIVVAGRKTPVHGVDLFWMNTQLAAK